jgi:hypothetical protein
LEGKQKSTPTFDRIDVENEIDCREADWRAGGDEDCSSCAISLT